MIAYAYCPAARGNYFGGDLSEAPRTADHYRALSEKLVRRHCLRDRIHTGLGDGSGSNEGIDSSLQRRAAHRNLQQ